MLRPIKSRIKKFFNPPFLNLIEVGAAGDLQGGWRKNRDKINYRLRFEPRENSKQDKHMISIDTALWSKAETRPFYVIGKGGLGSSLLEPNIEYVREHYEELQHNGDPKLAGTWFDRTFIREVQMVQTRTLDDVLDNLEHQPPFHFLQVDTQGADYYIFKGAEKFLASSCVGIQSELYLYPLYKDTVLMPDVVAYLDQLGFSLVKLQPQHGTFASQQDGIFLKRGADQKILNAIKAIFSIDS